MASNASPSSSPLQRDSPETTVSWSVSRARHRVLSEDHWSQARLYREAHLSEKLECGLWAVSVGLLQPSLQCSAHGTPRSLRVKKSGNFLGWYCGRCNDYKVLKYEQTNINGRHDNKTHQSCAIHNILQSYKVCVRIITTSYSIIQYHTMYVLLELRTKTSGTCHQLNACTKSLCTCVMT